MAVSREPAQFIRDNLLLAPVPGLDHIVLFTAHSGSRLSRLTDPDDDDPPAPYWAYPWAGGLALARHIAHNPGAVSGKRVLDLGAGSGLVGIAAAKAGAEASAAEIDRYGRAAIGLNARANKVALPLVEIDIDGPAPVGFKLVVAGDVFYNGEVAGRMLPFLERCRHGGLEVLIGDPARRDLPVDRLERMASYPVGDVGDKRDSAERVGSVYRLR